VPQTEPAAQGSMEALCQRGVWRGMRRVLTTRGNGHCIGGGGREGEETENKDERSLVKHGDVYVLSLNGAQVGQVVRRRRRYRARRYFLPRGY
jgi:hypothetical protein